MPSTYSHYHFGCLVYEQLPKHIKTMVQKHRAFYDAGQNGPDLLLYHAPLKGSTISKMNHDIHFNSGYDFFKKTLSLHKNQEERLAYIYGYICHFVLDVYCHPYIETQKTTNLSHMLIEREFERYLLEKNGLNPFHYNLTTHLKPSRQLYETMALFVEGASSKDIQKTLFNMKCMYAFTKASNALKRKIIYAWMDSIKKPYLKDFVFPKDKVEACSLINVTLNEYMQEAIAKAVRLIVDYEKNDLQDDLYLEVFG